MRALARTVIRAARRFGPKGATRNAFLEVSETQRTSVALDNRLQRVSAPPPGRAA